MTDLEHIAILLEQAYQATVQIGLYIENVNPRVALACGMATGAIAKAKHLVREEIDAAEAKPP